MLFMRLLCEAGANGCVSPALLVAGGGGVEVVAGVGGVMGMMSTWLRAQTDGSWKA